MTRFSIILLTLASFSAAIGQLLFKFGAAGRERLIDFINLQIAGGLAFYLLGTAIWIYALSAERLTDVYAFTALTFVLVYVFAVAVAGEPLQRNTIIGAILILAGLYLITSRGTA